MIKFWREFKEELKKVYKTEKNRILKDIHWEKEDPKVFSQSVAAGVFIGFTPTVGLQTIICYIWSRMFKKNFFATFLGTFIPSGTPIQIPFTYFLCYKVGQYLLGNTDFTVPGFKSIGNIYEAGKAILKPLWLGSIFIGILTGVIMYFVVLVILQKKSKKHHEQKNR